MCACACSDGARAAELARSTTARRSAARPRACVWRACAVAPSTPIRMSLQQPHRVVAVAGVERELRRSPSTGVHARRHAPVVEARRADQLDRHLALHALDGAHQQVVGVVVGRRARVAPARAAPCQSPIVSASRTTSQPVGVIQVVSSTLVPGS